MSALNQVQRWLFGRDLAVWYSPDYRLPLSALETRTGFTPRRADHAVWFAAVRAEGFGGRVLVLDLDAHPPDGTAACLKHDRSCFIGSISGAEWGPLPGVDETVLPPGAGDAEYLRALEGLLQRMPDG